MSVTRNNKEIDGAITQVVSHLSSMIEDNVELVLTPSSGGLIKKTQLQLMFSIKYDDPLKQLVHELIVTHAAATEKLGPGGFRRLLSLLSNNHDSACDDLVTRHATSQDVIEIVTQMIKHRPEVAPVVWDAVRLAGFAGRVIVEKTSSTMMSVELVCGYTFELTSMLSLDFSFVQPRIVCIDGYVESVSEVHHLLEAAASAKEPVIVFLRGASDDVKHTLRVNYDRGSLRVMPVCVPFDLDGMNTLVDLSVVSGTDVVSSLKGDLISSIKFEELPTIEQVTMFRNRIVLLEKRTSRNVAVHCSALRERRLKQHVEDVGKILDKRIRSLSPNHVVIRVPNDINFVVNSQAIDYALRSVKSAVDYGVSDHGLAATEYAARVHASRCRKSLNDLGCVVLDA